MARRRLRMNGLASKRNLLSAFVFASFGCQSVSENGREEFHLVLENPEKHNGEIIKIDGFAVIEFENTNLYLDKNAAENEDPNNCISLLISKDDYEKFSDDFNRRYVRLEGLYKAQACEPTEICTWYCASEGILVSDISLQ